MPLGVLFGQIFANISYLMIMLLVVGLHAIVLRGIQKHRYAGAIIATVVLLLVSVLTGFTIGIFIFPSVAMLSVAIGRSIMSYHV